MAAFDKIQLKYWLIKKGWQEASDPDDYYKRFLVKAPEGMLGEKYSDKELHVYDAEDLHAMLTGESKGSDDGDD